MNPHDFLRIRQNKFPLDHPLDRAKQLYGLLQARLPTDVTQLFDTGQVACAEIGIPTPNAVTYSLPGNCSAIAMWTGIERFLYRVARALSTRVRVYSDPGAPPVEPSLSPEQTMSLLAEIFENFRRFGISKGPSGYAISDSQKEVASMLCGNAETFVLGHEIGHTVINHKRGNSENVNLETPGSSENKVLLSQAEEVAADQLALQFVLGATGSPSGTNNLLMRMAYAGAEFTVRVFKCLEYIGFPFEVSHPLPSTRLEILREHTRKMCHDAAQFRELSTVAFAFDELLESLELALKPKPPGVKTDLASTTPERSVSRMSVILEEGVKGALSQEKVKSSVTEIFVGLESQRIQDIVQACVAAFGHPTGTDESEMEVKKRDLLKRVIGTLPQDLKREFEKAMGADH